MRLFLAICLGFPLAAFADEVRLHTFKEPHMGTEFTIRVFAEESSVRDLTRLVDEVFDRIADLNEIFSDYLPESEINDLARAPSGTPVALSPELYQVLSKGQELSRRTDGAFDVTAGPLIRLWRLSRKNRRLPTDDQLKRAKARTGFGLIALDPATRSATKLTDGMLFDLGGIAKGYAADAALEMLKENGYSQSLVAASGDIVVGDPPPGKEGWRIGIETLEPARPSPGMPVVQLVNQAVSTSGDARQFVEIEGKRFSHIVSTKTGLGLTERIGASVIAPNATTSDSYATAVTLLGSKDGLQFIENNREIECQIVTLENGHEVTIQSDGFSRFKQQETKEKAPLSPP